MDGQTEGKKLWLTEVENFFSYQENATAEIRTRSLNPDECNDISEMFQHDSNELLLQRPSHVSDEQVITRLEQLDNRLTTSLAMVCKVKPTDE